MHHRIEIPSDWIRVARSEFGEMPGLRLSVRQAQRLWNLDSETVKAILDTLEAAHFLRRSSNEMYCRADADY